MREFAAALERRRARRRERGPARVHGPPAREHRAELRGRVRDRARSIAARRVARAAEQRGAAPRAARAHPPPKPADFEELRGVVLQDWTDATMAEQRTAPCARSRRSTPSKSRPPRRERVAARFSARRAAALLASVAAAHEMTHGGDGPARDARPASSSGNGSRAATASSARGSRRGGPTGCTRRRERLALRRARLERHVRYRRRRRAYSAAHREDLSGSTVRRRVHTLTSAQPDDPALRLRRRPAGIRRDRARLYRARRRAHPRRLRSPAVRDRAAVPRRLQSPARADDHGVHAGAQPDAGAERARLAHAAAAARRGDDRAVDRARGRRSAARRARRSRGAGPPSWRSCSASCTASASRAR